MTLVKGQTLAFRYRVLYRDGVWTGEELGTLSAEFVASGR